MKLVIALEDISELIVPISIVLFLVQLMELVLLQIFVIVEILLTQEQLVKFHLQLLHQHRNQVVL